MRSPAPAPLPNAVCVLGLGLIGGSLMRASAGQVPTYGWSPTDTTRDAAAADGFDVSATLDAALARAVADDALVVLAAPATQFPSLLKSVGAQAPNALLTDVAGVKVPVVELVEKHAPEARFVGSHPMAGTTESGWAAGSADLFDGAAWVTCIDEDTALETWAPIAGLALTVGSRVVPTEAAAHDAAVARISHLPHLLALMLAQVGAAGGALARSLAAGSFASGTRVAGTRPDLIRAMCETNRWPLLDALDDALGILGVARGSLASTGSLVKITEGGHEAHQEFQDSGTGLVAVQLSGDDLVEQLLAVGASGGYVTGINGNSADLVIDAQYPDEI